MKRVSILCLVVLLYLLLPQSRVFATSYELIKNGSWHTATNWNPTGVPNTADDIAYLRGSYEVTIAGDVTSKSLYEVNYEGWPESKVTQSSGAVVFADTLQVGGQEYNRPGARYTLNGGSLWAKVADISAHYDGGGKFYQNGGDALFGTLRLGTGNWTGLYRMTGGTLLVTNTFQFVGSSVTFTQSLGSVTSQVPVQIAGSRYYLSGGNLTITNANAFTFTSGGRFSFSGAGGELYLRGTDWEWTNLSGLANSSWWIDSWQAASNDLLFTDTTIGGVAYTLVKPVLITKTLSPTVYSTTNADFNGQLVARGGGTATPAVFWGYSDGGTNKGDWTYTNWFNAVTSPVPVAVASNIMVSSNQHIYYRFYATNSVGEERWATNTADFYTLPIWIEIIDTNAMEQGQDPGSIFIWRGGLTTEVCTIELNISGTAANGTDYSNIVSSVDIPIGASNVLITVTPVDDVVRNEYPNEKVTIALCAGKYLLGSPVNATIEISDNDLDFTSIATGSWHDGGTWNRSPYYPMYTNDIAYLRGSYEVTIAGDVTSKSLYEVNYEGWPESKVTQNSGAVVFVDTLQVGGQEYNRPGARYTLNGGSLSARVADISAHYDGGGKFYQNGGDARFGTLRLGTGNWTGLYRMTGGTLLVTNTFQFVGSSVTFTQSLGSVTSQVPVQIAGSRYYLSGGNLTITNATPFTFGGGYFDFKDGAVLNLKGSWTFAGLTNIVNSDFRISNYKIVNGDLGFSAVDIGGEAYTRIEPALVVRSSAETAVAIGNANFNGFLVSEGGAQATVCVFWGTADGLTNKENWEGTNIFAANTFGTPIPYSTNITYPGNDRYYYRYYATNAFGEAWATQTVNFLALEIWVSSDDAGAWETGPDTGTLTFWRGGLTNEALDFTYNISGNAGNAADYSNLNGTIQFQIGSSSASVTIAPIDDAVRNEYPDEYVTLSVPSSGYIVGNPSNGTVSIRDNDLDFTSIATGSWHDGGTWNRSPYYPMCTNDIAYLRGSYEVTIAGDVTSKSLYEVNYEGWPESKVTQNSGAVVFGDTLQVGGQEYNRPGARYTLNGGSLWAKVADISAHYDGGGKFYQNGGDARFGTLRLGTGSWTGLYRMTGGTLLVTNTFQFVGSLVTFTQSLGSVTSQVPVQIAGSRYYLSGGNLTIASTSGVPLQFSSGGRVYFGGSGTLYMTGRWDFASLTAITNSSFYLDDSAATATDLVFNQERINGIEYTKIEPGTQVIDNANGATNVTMTSAWLNGVLYDAGSPAFTVYVYWGTNNGGVYQTAWQHEAKFTSGIHSVPELFTTNITGLVADTVYFYRFFASNANMEAWAPFSETLVVAPVTLSAVDTNAAETAADPGSFVATRSVVATNGPLTVQYSIGGNAQNGFDYETLSGSATIPAGQTSVVIQVVPINDNVMDEGTETVILTLLPRGYVVGEPNQGTVYIEENDWAYYWDVVEGIWNVDSNWETEATNWTARGYPGQAAGDTAIIDNGGRSDIPAGTPALTLVGLRVGSDRGTGTLYQAGSTVTVSAAVMVMSNSVYTVADGRLTAQDGIRLVSGMPEFGVSSQGVVTAGSLQLFDGGASGEAVFRMDGGSLTATNIRLGTVSGGGERHALADQTLGDVVSDGQVTLSCASWSAAGGSTIYKLYGGTLTIKHFTAPLVFNPDGPYAKDNMYLDFGAGVLRLNGEWNYSRLTALSNANFKLHGAPLLAGDLAFATNMLYGMNYTFISAAMAVDNANGATGVTTTNAWLNGTLVSTGAAFATVSVFWGDNDGGTNKVGAWDHKETFTEHSGQCPASYATNVILPVADVNYFYRYYVTNALGEKWATNTAVFMPSELVVEGVDTNASEVNQDPALFRLRRPAGCTNASLRVPFSLTGTAQNGVDYDTVATEATIPEGTTSVDIVISPIRDMVVDEGTETATLTLLPGIYIVGVSNSATAQIAEADRLTDWSSAGLRIGFSRYNRDETLHDFPALVVVSPTNGFVYGEFASAVGADLRFVDASKTNMLSYEIEEWNTNGESYVWVRLPELMKSSTRIYAYWGNTNATNLAAFTTNGLTWDQAYIGVWHLRENVTDGQTGGTHYDSTRNRSNGTQNKNSRTAGISSFGQQFNGGDEYVGCGNMAVYDTVLDGVTIDAWVKLSAAGNAPVLVGRGNGLLELRLKGAERRPEFWGAGEWTTAPAGKVLQLDRWYYVTGTFDETADSQVLYVDGEPVAAGYPTPHLTHSGELRLAADTSGDYLPGCLDEVRLSNVARSANWVWACWMTQSRNSDFTTYYQGTVLTIR